MLLLCYLHKRVWMRSHSCLRQCTPSDCYVRRIESLDVAALAKVVNTLYLQGAQRRRLSYYSRGSLREIRTEKQQAQELDVPRCLR